MDCVWSETHNGRMSNEDELPKGGEYYVLQRYNW